MKRAAHRLADVASTLQNSSCRTVASRAYSKSAVSRAVPRTRQYKPASEVNLPVAQELRKVLSPEACGWLEGKPFVVQKQVKKPPPRTFVNQLDLPPSPEKVMFDSIEFLPGTSMAPSEDGEDGEIGDTIRIPAGSLVEIRRSQMPVHAVVLFSILLGRRWVVHSLTSTGEVWAHHEHDVTFQIPQFVNKKLAERCGMFSKIESEDEGAARVEVLKKLRTFKKHLEYHCHKVPQIARQMSFYDLVAHPDPKKWTQITAREAAEKLLGNQSAFSEEELFAVQSYLFDCGEYFVSVARRFLQMQTFWVRPRKEVDDIRKVQRMVLQSDPALDDFVHKAREVVARSRQCTVDSWNEPPTKHSLNGPQWTETDRVILRFLIASLQNRRVIQTDPYDTCLSFILKKLDMHTCASYDVRVTHTFLVELGVIAPWEDPNSREGIMQESAPVMDIVPVPSTPILPEPLGSNDLYPRDIVESIRHDFADMPAYVVDDWGAEELDDGISVERIPSDPDHVWLHVHVADPTTLLPPTHDLARHAMKLTTSSYHVVRTIPMFPTDAGFRRFSLGNTPGQPDLALTFSAKVSSEGDIVEYKIRPSVVRNVHLIRYDEVDALLGNKDGIHRYPFGNPNPVPEHSSFTADSTTIDDLRLLEQVTRNLGRRRLRNGAVLFAFPKPEIRIEPRPLSLELMGTDEPSAFRGFPKMTYAVETTLETGARGVIAECMKTAGQIASLFFRDRGIPALRRSVGSLQTEMRDGLEELMANRSELGIIDVYDGLRARVSAPPGKYVTTPGPHSLLGVLDGEGYMKVTSPLRRFSDILAHWQIKHALLAEKGEHRSPILFEEDWLLRLADDMGARELEAKRAEIRQQQFWAHTFLLRWMNNPAREKREHDPLRTLKGRVVEGLMPLVRSKGWQCTLHVTELALDGRVLGWPTNKPAPLGEEVDVSIDQVLLGTHPILDLKLK